MGGGNGKTLDFRVSGGENNSRSIKSILIPNIRRQKQEDQEDQAKRKYVFDILKPLPLINSFLGGNCYQCSVS